MSSRTRRNYTSKFGPFGRKAAGHRGEPARRDEATRELDYTGRHASPQSKTARLRVGKVVPAAAGAAALAAGAAAYVLVGTGAPQASQLDAALKYPVSASNAANVTSQANAAAMVRAAKASASASSKPTAKASAKPSASATQKPSPAASATQAAAAPASGSAQSQQASAQAPVTQAAAAAATTSATKPAAATISCAQTGGLLPDNVTAIVSFLVANGYSDNAAAGIAGNMYQESKGNPESVGMGGGGLIGFTPLPSGYVTGNPATDLQTQLNAVLTYNQIWSGYIPALNSAASPAAAADIYVTDFERAGIPAASTREQAAQDVASACGI